MPSEIRITSHYVEFLKDGEVVGDAMLSTRPPFAGTFRHIITSADDFEDINFNEYALFNQDPDAPRIEYERSSSFINIDGPKRIFNDVKFDKENILEDRADLRGQFAPGVAEYGGSPDLVIELSDRFVDHFGLAGEYVKRTDEWAEPHPPPLQFEPVEHDVYPPVDNRSLWERWFPWYHDYKRRGRI